MTTIALIVVLLLGGGASVAAESATPGNILYPVKVGVNEEVRSWIAVSDEAQAKWDARRAERRLEEAEKLAAKGELDAEAKATLEARFKEHAAAFEERADRIEAKQDAHATFEIHSNFEASLKAHERILAQMEGREGGLALGTILTQVKARLNAETAERNKSEVEVTSQTDVKFKAAAKGKLNAAENKIAEVKDFVAKTDVSVEAKADAQAKLQSSETIIARGKVEMTAGSYGKAFASFEEAMRIAQEAKLVVATSNRINLNIRSSEDNRSATGTENSNNTGVQGSVKVQIGY